MSFPATSSYPSSATFPSSASFPATMAWPGAGPAPSPPATPENLTATPGDTQVVVEWDASDGATGYKVYRDGVLLISPNGHDSISITDEGLPNGEEVSYTVTATNAGGESAQSGAVTATPYTTTIADMVAWYKYDAGVFTDTARTTPATTTGDQVRGYADQSGAGNHATSASGEGLLLDTAFTLLSGQARNVETDYNACLTAPVALDKQAFTFCFILRVDSLRETWGIGGLPYKFLCSPNGGGSGALYIDTTTGHLVAASVSSLTPASSWCFVVYRSSALGIKLWVDGTSATQTANAAESTTAWDIGGVPSNIVPSGCDFRDVMIFDRALTDGEVSSLYAYSKTRGVPSSITDILVIAGDSISASVGSTLNRGWLKRMALPSTVRVYNTAVGSQSASASNSEGATFADPLFDPAKNNIYVVWAGTNIGAETAAQNYGHIKDSMLARVSAGADHTIAVTMLPRTGEEVYRAALNTLISAVALDVPGALVADPAANHSIGDDGDNTDATYYAPSTVHPNDAGYAVIAPINKAVIDTVLA